MEAAKANGPKKEQNQRPVIPGPTNPMVTPLLSDFYQFTMAYSYWKAAKHNERAVFDLYFRKNPFGGEYTIFAGLEECIRFIANFKFTAEEIAFIRASLPKTCEDGFYDYLRGIDCSDVEVHAVPEGSVAFPKVPLLIVEGPIAVVQLLETPILNLINYASLVSTNAARHRFVAGKSKLLLEFGLRRAQGPDGGIGASKYSYIGGFDATSNVEAGRLFGIPLRGTHSHAFVSSFMSPDEIVEKSLKSYDGSSTCEDFVSLAQTWLSKIKMLTMRNGLSLYPMCLPGVLQPAQLSDIKMSFYEGNGTLNMDMTGMLPVNQETPTNTLFNIPNQSTNPSELSAANLSIINSGTSFGMDSSIQGHLRPFLPHTSSKVKEICREDMLPCQQLNVDDHSQMNSFDFEMRTKATVSIPLETQASDVMDNALEAFTLRTERPESLLLSNLGHNPVLAPHLNRTHEGRGPPEDDIKAEGLKF